MSAEVTDAAIREFLHAIAKRLEQATAVAKAAQACAAVGHRNGAVTMLDAKQPLFEATTSLNAASLINRCSEA